MLLLPTLLLVSEYYIGTNARLHFYFPMTRRSVFKLVSYVGGNHSSLLFVKRFCSPHHHHEHPPTGRTCDVQNPKVRVWIPPLLKVSSYHKVEIMLSQITSLLRIEIHIPPSKNLSKFKLNFFGSNP